MRACWSPLSGDLHPGDGDDVPTVPLFHGSLAAAHPPTPGTTTFEHAMQRVAPPFAIAWVLVEIGADVPGRLHPEAIVRMPWLPTELLVNDCVITSCLRPAGGG